MTKRENNRHSQWVHFRENAWRGDNKTKTDRHGEWYHFSENAWSWDDKNGKNNRHSEAGVVCGPVTKLPPLSCVMEWTRFSFHEWGIASRSAEAVPQGSR